MKAQNCAYSFFRARYFPEANAPTATENATINAQSANLIHMIPLRVEDRGPGIPPELLEKVFEPYFRVEGSRSRGTGGTGLGLTIARNMVLLNNGSLTLENREGGGLRAVITLPALKTAKIGEIRS